MELTNDLVTKAIIRSQHCQRNWDLASPIPLEDVEVIKTAVTQCPSKQNIAYYNVHFITNRDVIEEIHSHTRGFVLNPETKEVTTNPQTLANLLVVFTKRDFVGQFTEEDTHRNTEMDYVMKNPDPTSASYRTLESDSKIAVGIAAGYCNLTSNLLGYSTGCCTCFDKTAIQSVLGIQDQVMLLMGVGKPNKDINRRVHHADKDIVFPTKRKVEINVTEVS